MGRGPRFLEDVDLKPAPLPSDSLLPWVEGNLTGYTGGEAGRSLKDKVGVGLNLAAKFTRKYRQKRKKRRKKNLTESQWKHRGRGKTLKNHSPTERAALESLSNINNRRTSLGICGHLLHQEETLPPQDGQSLTGGIKQRTLWCLYKTVMI